jgi:DMSO reductase family type II enzyme chaperone
MSGPGVRSRVAEANELLGRSAVYRLVAQALAYPAPEDVAHLLEEDLPFAAALGPPEVGVSELADVLQGVSQASLEEEYRTVFTHVHSADCSLYETDYTAPQAWRQSQELADLGGFYRAFGVEEQMERPDHASVELEFLHVLAYKAAWAAANGDGEHLAVCERAHEAFLRDHALRWMPGLLQRLEVRGAGGPYAAIARLALRFLAGEAARFGLQVAPTAPDPDVPSIEEVGLCE